LPLTAGQLDAAFADQRVVTLRQRLDEFIGLRVTGRLLDFSKRRTRLSVGNVFGGESRMSRRDPPGSVSGVVKVTRCGRPSLNRISTGKTPAPVS